MSYFLQGSDGDASHGLGIVPDPPVYETCGYDSACIQRNVDKQTAYQQQVVQDLWATYNSGPMPVGYMTAGDSPAVQQQVAANYNVSAPSSATQQQSSARGPGGSITFTTSRGGTSAQVGDTWHIAITGATPNAPVTVTGRMPSGPFSQTPMGSTDSSGNFSKAGTFDASTVGNWQELWEVGGAPSLPQLLFTVAPAAVASSGAASSGAASSETPVSSSVSSVPVPVNTTASSDLTIGGFDLSTIPTWGWLAAAGVAAFFMFGNGGR